MVLVATTLEVTIAALSSLAEPADRDTRADCITVALVDIVSERRRQELKGAERRAVGVDWRSCADPAMAGGDGTRFLVLGEEVGEVANAVLEAAYAMPSPDTVAYQVLESEDVHALVAGGEAHLREELVQVAAVALAWIEAIDARAAR